mmetsp:Transcript_28/g.51  ORF Transcript_28/g.51 Transcript_28/m.51 type:complete len:313 (-) Transcript_28:2523-3461(-)
MGDWKDFSLYSDHMVQRFNNEVDRVEAQNKDTYSPQDFSSFDALHYCGYDYLAPFLESLYKGQSIKVLDLGCGIGGGSRLIASNYQSEVTAVDYLEGYCQVHRRINSLCNLENIQVLQGDASTLNLEELGLVGNCDLVFSIQVFLHIPDKTSLFQKCFQALKPGGKLYIEDWAVQSSGPFNQEEEKVAEILGMIDRLSEEEYKKQVEEAGFLVEESRFRTKEWSRYIWSRAESLASREEELVAMHGKDWWEAWSSWSLGYGLSAFHSLEMSLEEIKTEFPTVCQKVGEDTVAGWLQARQKFGGYYLVATKPN